MAALAVALLTGTVGILAPSPVAADVAEVRLADRAPELVAAADEAALRLGAAEAGVTSAGRRVATAELAVAAAEDALDDARARVADETGHLRSLAVAAYTGGGLTPEDLAVAVLTSDGFDLAAESRLVLVDITTDTLLGRRNAAVGAVPDAQAALAAARDELGARQADQAAAEAERDERRAEALDARGRADQAAALALLRATTPRPEPHRSGVVPPPVVPAVVVARVGGEIPRPALEAYWRAASAMAAEVPGCEMDWALVAAIGLVETRHGTYGGAVPEPDGAVAPAITGIALDGSGGTAVIDDTDGGALDGDPFLDRAVGPMQFLPRTWGAHGGDGNGDGVVDAHNIFDAAQGAARYLCRSASGSVTEDPAARRRAVFSYNRAGWYVAKVVAAAERYRLLADPEAEVPPEIELPPPGAAGGDPDDPTQPVEPPDPDDPAPTTTTSTTATTSTTSSSTTSTTVAVDPGAG